MRDKKPTLLPTRKNTETKSSPYTSNNPTINSIISKNRDPIESQDNEEIKTFSDTQIPDSNINSDTTKDEEYKLEEEKKENAKLPLFNNFSSPETSSLPVIGAEDDDNASIDDILALAVEKGASDIHMSVNSPVMYRIDGDLTHVSEFDFIITNDWMEKMTDHIMNNLQKQDFVNNHEMDLSYALNGTRFRVNCFYQRQSIASVMRIIPKKVLTLADINAPSIFEKITHNKRGLVLVTGPTGSGKSSTLAAMINEINETRPDHIITVEDPIEFVHQNKKSLINQREIGADTKSFKESLKRLLRQDPDVILIGELRDPETIEIALTAAETGHLVFGTLHTQSADKTINRIIDSFPAESQNQIKAQLSGTLQAVISQTLLKKIGGGRTMATEIMVRTDAIASNIREGNTSSIYSALQSGKSHGMHTLDKNLEELVNKGVVTAEEAIPHMRYSEKMRESYNISDDNNGDW